MPGSVSGQQDIHSTTSTRSVPTTLTPDEVVRSTKECHFDLSISVVLGQRDGREILLSLGRRGRPRSPVTSDTDALTAPTSSTTSVVGFGWTPGTTTCRGQPDPDRLAPHTCSEHRRRLGRPSAVAAVSVTGQVGQTMTPPELAG